jgi:predicted RNA binding protein YcfA (HicA-like mRNA interferase family)
MNGHRNLHLPERLGEVSLTEKPNEQVHPRNIKTTGGCILKVREIIKIIEADGWYIVATKGSHRQYKHPEKPGRITIAGHLADDLAPGTMNSIFKQAQLKD